MSSPNRAERRRQARAEAKKQRHQKPPVLIAGAGIAAAALGGKYEAKPHAQLPPKEPGKHRWVAVGSWVLNDVQVNHAFDPDKMKILDNENLMHLGIGCWDCEEQITDISVDSVCPAPGDD